MKLKDKRFMIPTGEGVPWVIRRTHDEFLVELKNLGEIEAKRPYVDQLLELSRYAEFREFIRKFQRKVDRMARKRSRKD